MTGNSFMDHWDLIQDVLTDHLTRGVVRFTDHAIKRMVERSIEEKGIEDVLKRNMPHEMFEPFTYPYGPEPFKNPDPVFSVTGKWVNKDMVVAVAIKKRRKRLAFYIVTVFNATEYSRHIQ